MSHRACVASFVVGVVACVAAGCTNSTGGDDSGGPGSGGGGGPEVGTVVSGTITFSPTTDSLSKFDYPSGETPSLDIETYSDGCSYAAIEDGMSDGVLAWQFQAPGGAAFSSLSFANIDVYADGRATSSAFAQAVLIDSDDTSNVLPLATAKAAGHQLATADDVSSWVSGKRSFFLQFSLNNPGYTSELSRIFVQALRLCPGDPTPFVLSAE